MTRKQSIALSFILVLLCGCSIAGASEARPNLIADVSKEVVDLGALSYIVDDPTGTLSSKELLANSSDYSAHHGDTMITFSQSTSAHWLRVSLSNPTSQSLKRLLVFSPSWLDDLRVTLVAADGSAKEQRAGILLPYSARAMPHRKVNLLLEIPPGDSTFLLRAQSRGPFAIEMSLWDTGAYFMHEAKTSAHIIFAAGVIGAMVIFAFILFLTSREPVYLGYVLYVSIFLLVTLASYGYLDAYLWPNTPELKNWFITALLYLYAAATLYFAMVFLELRSVAPRLYGWGKRLLVLIIATLVIRTLANDFEPELGGELWMLVVIPLVLSVGIALWRRGDVAAKFFVPATIAGFLGSSVTIMMLGGDIPYSFAAGHAVNIGMGIDAVILSFGLGYRVRATHFAAKDATTALLEATQRQAEQLEAEVRQRTAELRAANAAKDKFFSIIAHDLRGPVHGLVVFFNEVVRSSSDFNDELLGVTRRATKNVSELLEQLLVWARSQRGEIKYKPANLDIGELLKETEELYFADARAKNISLQLVPYGEHLAYADKGMVKTILRNLIGNALKFTPSGGRISARVFERDGNCAISIIDTGIGIDEEKRSLLFKVESISDPRLKSTSGTGLGLILCREFVEKSGGTIAVESAVNQGSTFTFTLPGPIVVTGERQS